MHTLQLVAKQSESNLLVAHQSTSLREVNRHAFTMTSMKRRENTHLIMHELLTKSHI